MWPSSRCSGCGGGGGGGYKSVALIVVTAVMRL